MGASSRSPRMASSSTEPPPLLGNYDASTPRLIVSRRYIRRHRGITRRSPIGWCVSYRSWRTTRSGARQVELQDIARGIELDVATAVIAGDIHVDVQGIRRARVLAR